MAMNVKEFRAVNLKINSVVLRQLMVWTLRSDYSWLVYVSPHDTPLCDILPTAISCLVLILDGYFQNVVLCALASLYHAPFLRGVEVMKSNNYVWRHWRTWNFNGSNFRYNSGGVPFICCTFVIHSVVLPCSVLKLRLCVRPVTVKMK